MRPWGKPVLNVANCSTPGAKGGAAGWGGCEALLNGTLDVLRRTTQLLNSRGKVHPLTSSYTSHASYTPLHSSPLHSPQALLRCRSSPKPMRESPAALRLQAATLRVAGAALRQPSVLRTTSSTEDLAGRGAG